MNICSDHGDSRKDKENRLPLLDSATPYHRSWMYRRYAFQSIFSVRKNFTSCGTVTAPQRTVIKIWATVNFWTQTRAPSDQARTSASILRSYSTWAICTRRTGKLSLYKARSRLYRSQCLQVNSKYACESSRRDLHNALLCTVIMESRLVL